MIKTKTIQQDKAFDTVKTFRTIKDVVSNEISEMNIEQIKAYLKRNSLLFKKEQENLFKKV